MVVGEAVFHKQIVFALFLLNGDFVRSNFNADNRLILLNALSVLVCKKSSKGTNLMSSSLKNA